MLEFSILASPRTETFSRWEENTDALSVTSLSVNSDPVIGRIRVPKSFDRMEAQNALIPVFLDLFLIGCRKEKSFFPASDSDYYRWYKPALAGMLREFMFGNGYVQRKVYLDFEDAADSSYNSNERSGFPEKEHRLAVLQILYTELIQMIEGRHFTLFETGLFQYFKAELVRKENVFGAGGCFQDGSNKACYYDIYLAYQSFLHRYTGEELKHISNREVHVYPCYRADWEEETYE